MDRGFRCGPESKGKLCRRVSCRRVACSDSCFKEISGRCAENEFLHGMFQIRLEDHTINPSVAGKALETSVTLYLLTIKGAFSILS